MQALINSLTDTYLSLLEQDKDYYSPSELIELGYPEFLVQRIGLELENNLADSIVPPKSDWANMQSESVVAAWEYFLYAIHEATRLPISYARSVIETCVADVIDLLVEPRKNIPQYLYGAAPELELDEIQERAGWLVVYTSFANVLPKYMIKKGISSLSREKCETIIAQLDSKLTANFTALQWAQHFEPWFALMGESIDSELVRLFFLDKDDHTRAARFDRVDGGVSKTELIEILTPPVIEDEDFGYVSSTPERDTNQDNETIDNQGVEHSSDQDSAGEIENESDLNSSSKEAARTDENKSEPKAIFELETVEFESEEEQEIIGIDGLVSDADIEEDEEEIKPVYQRFQLDISDENESVNAEDETELEQADESSPKIEEPVIEDEPQAKELDRSASDKPLWAQFLPDEESLEEELEEPKNEEEVDANSPTLYDMYSKENGSNESEKGLADAYLDEFEPIIDLVELEKEEKQVEAGITRLNYHVSDMRIEFIDNIFGENEDAFNEALDQIAQFEEWPKAGKYIAGEIFRLNQVDLSSDVAIDFIDRIQAYFLEKSGK